MTQDCLEAFNISFACKISKLGTSYYKSLQIGSTCSDNLLLQVVISNALLQQICCIDLETETCLSESQIGCIINNLQRILDNPCDC